MEVTGVQAGYDENELIKRAGRGDAYAFEQLEHDLFFGADKAI